MRNRGNRRSRVILKPLEPADLPSRRVFSFHTKLALRNDLFGGPPEIFTGVGSRGAERRVMEPDKIRLASKPLSDE
jgi:hypothetical protein